MTKFITPSAEKTSETKKDFPSFSQRNNTEFIDKGIGMKDIGWIFTENTCNPSVEFIVFNRRENSSAS